MYQQKNLISIFLCLSCFSIHLTAFSQKESGTFPITENGAVGDGKTINTTAIQTTIDHCSSKGGGIVIVPNGIFLTGSIFLKDKVNLLIEKGAILKGTNNLADYPLVQTRFEGVDKEWTAALINVVSLSNITISGEGTIDGSGTQWPSTDRKNFLNMSPEARDSFRKAWHGKPRLICFQNCTNSEISNLHLLNHSSWCVHILYSKNMNLKNLNIRAHHTIPSSDGIDVDSGSEINITGCDIDVNDDCISIKSGKDTSGLRVNRPSENIIIENCHFGYGHGGVAFGSETSGNIRNVTVKNCVADSGNWAPVRFKTQPSRGGAVENILFENMQISYVKQVFEFDMQWRMVPPIAPPAKVLPVFRNIIIKNFTGEANSLGSINGLKDSPITGITFVNCNLKVQKGLTITNTYNNDYSGLNAEVKEGKKIIEISE